MSDGSEHMPAAIDGHDAVAYFTEGRAVRGRAEHVVEHDGKRWLFSSEEHARRFEAAPERFAPSYGGRCAFATSLGKSETGDPARWHVRDGRLFLNSNGVAQLLWKVLPGRVAAADRNWAERPGDA